MNVGERDKKMNEMASIAAEAFCDKNAPPSATDEYIRDRPEAYLEYTIPYLTVRNLHFLKADSKWIKAFAIITGILTFVLVGLTIVLMIYAWRLDTVIHSLQSNASPTPSATPPAASSPTASPVTH